MTNTLEETSLTPIFDPSRDGETVEALNKVIKALQELTRETTESHQTITYTGMDAECKPIAEGAFLQISVYLAHDEPKNGDVFILSDPLGTLHSGTPQGMIFDVEKVPGLGVWNFKMVQYAPKAGLGHPPKKNDSNPFGAAFNCGD